jgi:hypothetical protein
MAKFSIKAGILLEVLNLAKKKGQNHTGDTTTLIEQCILNVGKKSIKIETTDLQEAVFDEITIKEFKCIEEGLIPVELEKSSDDKKKNSLIDILGRFKPDNDVEVDLQYGVIVIKRIKPRLTKKVNTINIDDINYDNSEEGIPIKYIKKNDSWLTDGGKKYTTKIVIDASQFKEVIKDGDQIAHRSYPITISNKDVIISVYDKDTGEGGDRELVTEKDGIRCGTKPVSSLFSYAFGNVFKNLKGKLNIWLYQDEAMIITQDNKSYEFLTLYSSLEVEPTEEDEIEVSEEEIDVDEIDLNDLEEISEEDLYVDPDEGVEIIEEDEIEEPEKPKPTMKWTIKQLIEYAVLNNITVNYSGKKKEIFETIQEHLESE